MSSFPFLIGCGRSGTTLLRSMFDSHPNMAIPHETYFVIRLAKRRERYEGSGSFASGLFLGDLYSQGGFQRMELPKDSVEARLREEEPATYAEAIRVIYGLYAARQGKSRYGDKTPIYVLHIPLLSELFAESKFVHIIRDGRDVTQSFMDGGWARRAEDAALYWKLQVERGMRAGRQLGADRYREVRYEDLLDDPINVLTGLCKFLELDYSNDMLRYHESAQRWATASRDAVRHRSLMREPTKGLRDWRTQMSKSDLAIVERLSGNLLTELGYELGAGRPSVWVSLVAGSKWAGWQSRRVVGHIKKSSAKV